VPNLHHFQFATNAPRKWGRFSTIQQPKRLKIAYNEYMLRYKVIANPIANHGNSARSIPVIQQMLKDLRIDFELVRTEYPQHAIHLAETSASEGFNAVIAIGGDGTVNEVLNGLMKTHLKGDGPACLGVIPTGRGNDFAFSMGIPTDIVTSCLALVAEKRHLIDVGRVSGGNFPQGHFFGNGVGIGFDAVVGFEAAKITWLSGFANYAFSAMRTMSIYSKAPLLQVELDDRLFVQACLLISVMNGRRMGGGFLMTPDSKPNDGLFDLCIARQMSQARMLTTIPRFLKGTQASSPDISMARSKRVKVTALQGSIPAHSDGETICTAGQSLTIDIFHQQAELIISFLQSDAPQS
jgi:YegS/Rv2252/BmrU family lipid kinase